LARKAAAPKISGTTDKVRRRNGSGFSSTPLNTLKTAVFTPMPSASAPAATAVKPGLRFSDRRP
jgi:hypothetical protein